jgi:hypothetical protein
VSDVALAAAGAVIFAVTTWASLAFGYQVFANLSEDQQAPDASPESPLVAPDGHDTPAPAMPLA